MRFSTAYDELLLDSVNCDFKFPLCPQIRVTLVPTRLGWPMAFWNSIRSVSDTGVLELDGIRSAHASVLSGVAI